MTGATQMRLGGHGAAVVAATAALLCSGQASAEEGRFDAQVFRPSAAPRDLVMIQKSEDMGAMTPSVGIYYDFALDPLVFITNDTGQTIDAVASRMQLTGLAAFGATDWLDLNLAVPFIAWQSSDNLRVIGSEGEIQSTAVGDMRVAAKLSLPSLNRKLRVSGFGFALSGNVNLPTGSPAAFSGDGVLTGGVTLIGDYRFDHAVLGRTIITTNLGVWLRPERQFAGVRVGDMASFGVAGEAYILQKRGLSVLGGVYGYPTLNRFPDSPRQIPAEALLALRWQTKSGITWTFGGSFGAACGFGAPALRFFSGITWHPKRSNEQKEIDIILERNPPPELDPDHDGLIGTADLCPEVGGPPENRGCPDEDSDGDGLVDRKDECPDLAEGPGGKKGCPVAFIRGDQIVILDKVHFATDKDIILDSSKVILDAVAHVLKNQRDIMELRIEGHTDVRASDEYNKELSQRRVNSVRAYLYQRGVEPSRLQATGYGHEQPLVNDLGCNRPDQELTPTCLRLTSKNRRVEFHILRRAPFGRVAFIEGEEILTRDRLHFAPKSAEILDPAKPTLDAVAGVLLAHPEIVKVRIEGHTDVHTRGSYSRKISQQQAESIQAYLIGKGVDASRLVAKGYGHSKMLHDDRHCNRPDEQLDPDCLFLTAKNQRVTFRILYRRAPAKPPQSGPSGADLKTDGPAGSQQRNTGTSPKPGVRRLENNPPTTLDRAEVDRSKKNSSKADDNPRQGKDTESMKK